MNAWLSPEEQRAARKHLAKAINFDAIVKKYSNRVESVNSSTWTGKACCPFHKNGQERTPSLNYSDKEKTFFCYGCSARGDVFDFIGMIKGTPGDILALKYQHSKGLDIDLSNVQEARPRTNLSEIHVKLSNSFREYLKALNDTPSYNEELSWTESIFKRIDERFSKLTEEDGDQARSFCMQIMLELERRKYEH